MFIVYFLYNVFNEITNVQFLAFIVWQKINFFLFFMQLLSIFILIKLFYTSNIFKKVFLLFFFLINKASLLFFYQIEVYACFLLVNEIMVCLFYFILFLYSSYSLKQKIINSNVFYLFFLYFFLFLGYYYYTPSHIYINSVDWWGWVDYYSLLMNSTFNDLVGPFYFFYTVAPHILLLIGFFLFILSVAYMYLMFKLVLEHNKQYYKHDNNIQNHTLYKPTVKFFKFIDNDF